MRPRTGRSKAAEARDTHESELASARAALAAATSEREALTKALAQSGGAALAEVRAEPGYERALAAALGDDLEAAIGGDGPRRWTGSESQAGDPPLAAGLEPLAAHASTPPELARRMAQVGVADEDTGQPLAIGQRLVTRDGRMRRWDGFVAEAGGAAAAERLIRVNRLAEIERQLAGAGRARSPSADVARDEAAQAVEQFRRDADAARAAASAAEREGREAARAADAAAAALERLEAQRTALGERRADLEPLLAASRESVTAAGTALDALARPGAAGRRNRAGPRGAQPRRARRWPRSAPRRRPAPAKWPPTASATPPRSASKGEWRTRARNAEARLAGNGPACRGLGDRAPRTGR